MTLTADPALLTIDRASRGTGVFLFSTSDPRRAHLEGLTGIVEGLDSFGTLHVVWSNGEHFGLNPSDSYSLHV